jgi:hypothetical protein
MALYTTSRSPYMWFRQSHIGRQAILDLFLALDLRLAGEMGI